MRNNTTDKKFRIVDDVVSGDFVFDAYGDSLPELFGTCAYACFFAMTDPDDIKPIDENKFEVLGDNIDELLFNFLAELIFLKDAENMFLSEFEIEIGDDQKSLHAIARGEAIDHNKHIIKTDVKAVTYYGLKINKDEDGYSVRIILDL